MSEHEDDEVINQEAAKKKTFANLSVPAARIMFRHSLLF